jgi:hypothetical protein
LNDLKFRYNFGSESFDRIKQQPRKKVLIEQSSTPRKKVLIELFQKFARWRARSPPRRPQTAKLPKRRFSFA